MPSKRYCINGCQRLVFAHHRCIYCYRKEILYPKSLKKPKKVYKIRNYSKKRVKLNTEYERIKEEKNKELIAAGKFKCFFTDKPFPKDYKTEYHHLFGRDGDLLCDKKYMFPAYRKPHLEYDRINHEYETLEKIDWYFPWLKRMKLEFPIIYYKEMQKIERANGKISKKTD